jgi:hypothetical protein
VTGPTIIPLLNGGPTGRHRVVCSEHNLDRTVLTEGHATNLLALHLRIDHGGTGPADLDVAAAAAFVVILDADPNMSPTAKTAVANVWVLLTGMEREAALAYAREVAATSQRAALLPF